MGNDPEKDQTYNDRKFAPTTTNILKDELFLLLVVIKKQFGSAEDVGDKLTKYVRILWLMKHGQEIIDLLEDFGCTTQWHLKRRFGLGDVEALRWIKRLQQAGILAEATEETMIPGVSGKHSPIYPLVGVSQQTIDEGIGRMKLEARKLRMARGEHPHAFKIFEEIRQRVLAGKLRKDDISMWKDVHPILKEFGIIENDYYSCGVEVGKLLREEGFRVWS